MGAKKINLENFYNPSFYTEPVVIPNGLKNSEVIGFLKSMLLIRIVELEIAQLVKEKRVNCPCHLAVGQEAIAVGISKNLNKADKVFGTHRSHAHYIALGGDVYALLAEIFGRITGCSGGMGGSMHLIAKENGFWGSVPIVGGTIPLAAGASLAAKLHKKNNIAVCFFGDGAVEEGVFHETMNLAAIQKLPVLFVCENNLYSSHLDIKQRQPSEIVSRYAQAHCIDYEIIDGNDVMVVLDVTKKLVNKMKQGKGPAFLEAVTYRWLGHVGANEDIDVGVRRSKEDLNKWKKRDPIRRLVEAMFTRHLLDVHSYESLEQEIRSSVLSILHRASVAPYPSLDKLFYNVYCE